MRTHLPRVRKDFTMADANWDTPKSSRPRPENTLFYRLFPSGAAAADSEPERELTYLAVRCTELALRLAEGHVWHYDPFRVGVWPPGAKGIPGMRGMCLFIWTAASAQPRDRARVGVPGVLQCQHCSTKPV